MAGFMEFKQLRVSKAFIGIDRLYDAITEHAAVKTKQFMPNLAKFLTGRYWEIKPEARAEPNQDNWNERQKPSF